MDAQSQAEARKEFFCHLFGTYDLWYWIVVIIGLSAMLFLPLP